MTKCFKFDSLYAENRINQLIKDNWKILHLGPVVKGWSDTHEVIVIAEKEESLIEGDFHE